MELHIAISAVLPWQPLYELIHDFHEIAQDTTLKISIEILSGKWNALASGRADLLICADAADAPSAAFSSATLGEIPFVFCVAPWHPLEKLGRPLNAYDIADYCAIVIADTSRILPPQTRGVLTQQATIIMPSTQEKIEAQRRGLGYG